MMINFKIRELLYNNIIGIDLLGFSDLKLFEMLNALEKE